MARQPAECKPIIRVRNVRKRFPTQIDRNAALKDVSFDVPENCLTAIQGRSGSGKSTILEIIGLIQGARVFSRLKYAAGVHRVQRVSETETQ